MKLIRRSLQALLLPACVMACQPAQAFSLSGSFSGTVEATQLPLNFTPPLPEAYYDGAAITGSFAIEVPNPTFQTGGDNFAYYLNGSGGSLSLSYTIKDQHFDYAVGPPDSSVILLNGASSPGSFQSAVFLTDFTPKYQGASFELSGPALFGGLDPNTLQFDPNAPPVFRTSFANAGAEMGFSVDVSQVAFNATPPVPEPSTYALFMAGAALLAWQQRRRLRPGLRRAISAAR
jgi:hypothetical protein